MSVVLSRAITLTAGTLYPAYRSYKAIRTKDVREYVKWMMYWIVFAMYTLVEALADIFISFWFPFYYQLKIIFVIWLLSPWTKGASILYRKWIHPTLSKHEQDIDALLEQAKSESYNHLVRLGSRSLLCARDIVAEAALRGQAQLVNQLQRSYSAGDVNRERSIEPRKRIEVEGIQEIDDEDAEHERSMGQRHESGDEEHPRRRKNRSRSGSRSRTLEGGENTFNTMPRRSQRRYM
ncbi:Receptor expression-enhancing protein [Trichostrongylus colubriformis]|uniref:Receptor expression-enhancing protein n=1 Tax=Trichostrongylus colubriformis TaxID=6319 RepID=A0AAN8FKF8_TRICO